MEYSIYKIFIKSCRLLMKLWPHLLEKIIHSCMSDSDGITRMKKDGQHPLKLGTKYLMQLLGYSR